VGIQAKNLRIIYGIMEKNPQKDFVNLDLWNIFFSLFFTNDYFKGIESNSSYFSLLKWYR
jgi:hypothetical protein